MSKHWTPHMSRGRYQSISDIGYFFMLTSKHFWRSADNFFVNIYIFAVYYEFFSLSCNWMNCFIWQMKGCRASDDFSFNNDCSWPQTQLFLRVASLTPNSWIVVTFNWWLSKFSWDFFKWSLPSLKLPNYLKLSWTESYFKRSWPKPKLPIL